MQGQNGQFYKKEVFDLLTDRLDRIEVKLDGNTAEIAKINAKFSYIFGVVAGITVIVNIAWVFVKERLFKA